MNTTSSMRGIAQGSFAPRSVGAISANLSNPWAMACAGNRHDARYNTAMNAGGLTEQRPAP